MFKFLKEKLSKAVSAFSKKVEEEAEVKKEEKEVAREVVEKKIDEQKPVSKPAPAPEATPVEKEEKLEEPDEEKTEKELEEKKEEHHEKKGFFAKLFHHEKKEEKEEEKEPAKEEAIEEEKEEPKKAELPEEPAEKEAEEEKSVEEPVLEEKKEEKKLEEEILAEEEKEEPETVTEEVAEFEETISEIVEEVKEEEFETALKEEKKEAEEEVEEEPVKRGFFAKLKETFTTVKLSEDKFEKLFWELEVVMLENNVAVEVIEKIKDDLRQALTTGKVSRKGIEEMVHDALKESVESLFIDNDLDLISEIKRKKDKPFIITFIGVNGSGKTTTMAKIASLLLKNKLSVVFAASDTFRAAAIQQLQEHADKLGVKMIKHDYESDPAAVAYDAVKHAQAKGIDVVLIDTAGRLHSNDNLMNELKKLVRVNKPDMKIFVGESITGNDCVEQAKLFNEAVGIDAIILAKADVDEKGGAAISVSFVTKKPIIYLGTGQRYEDLTRFDSDIIIKNIGL